MRGQYRVSTVKTAQIIDEHTCTVDEIHLLTKLVWIGLRIKITKTGKKKVTMVVSKEVFRAFMADKGNSYPYNAIRKTRNGIYPKWVLLASSQPHALFRRNGFHLLPTSCLSNQGIQNITVSGEGIPLPPEYDQVIWSMQYWGASYDGLWYQEVLSFIHSLLIDGEEMDEQYLFFDLVYLLFKKKLSAVFFHHGIMCTVTNAFEKHFNSLFQKNTRDFFELSVATIKYADTLVAFDSPTPVFSQPRGFIRGSEENPFVI
jgi:hypothetical protein